MADCEDKIYERRIRVISRATNPHGLALSKARARYNRYADRRTREEHDRALQWVRDCECDDNCIKGGTSVISSHRIYREWVSRNEKRATVRGIMEINAVVDCLDPVHASLLEEGTEELAVEICDDGNFEILKV